MIPQLEPTTRRSGPVKRILAGTCLVLTGIAGTLIYVHDNWTGGSTTLHPASDQTAAPAPPETTPTDPTIESSPTTATTTAGVQQELNDHESRISHLEVTTTTTAKPATTTTELPQKVNPMIPMEPATTSTTSEPTITTTTTVPKTWVEVARFPAPFEDSQRPPDSLGVRLETGVLRVTMRPLSWRPDMKPQNALWLDGDGKTPTSETCVAGNCEVTPGDHEFFLGVASRDVVGAWYGPSIDQYGQMGIIVIEELR